MHKKLTSKAVGLVHRLAKLCPKGLISIQNLKMMMLAAAGMRTPLIGSGTASEFDYLITSLILFAFMLD
jgi:hypothetical protein